MLIPIPSGLVAGATQSEQVANADISFSGVIPDLGIHYIEHI